ncbi:MAG TPA: hypothetical protein VF638_01020 [Sphingomonas sp.]|jgi:hypothetical protein
MRTLTQDTQSGVRETFSYDAADDTVVVQHSQDNTRLIDAIAKANSEGTKEVAGMRLVAEVPIADAMQFCQDRGIPWAKFLYGKDYDSEFKRFIQERPKLAYEHRGRRVAL